MKFIKFLFFSLFLFSTSLVTLASETPIDVYKVLDGTSDVSQVLDSTISSQIGQPLLEKKSNLTKSPSDYMFVDTNTTIGGFYDSYSGLHALKFINIIEKDSELDFKVFYASEYTYIKDTNLWFEFYKLDKSNQLNYTGAARFNTDGVNSIDLTISLPKEDFLNQEYIYVKVGTEDTNYPGYFSGLITFKVLNPSYYKTFKDVKQSEWYYTYINKFVDKGYISGYEDGTFRPNASITRAEFVKIVNRTFGLTAKTTTNFVDISKDWQKKEAAIGVKAGYLTNGKKFRPDDIITREEACKIVGVIAKLVGDGKLHYKDKDQIAKYAQVYVDGLVESGVLSKLDYFRPKDSLTRAEAVKILQVVSEL